MTRIRAVVFDLGHTLWDFAPTLEARRLRVLRMHQILRDAGIDVPAPRVLDDAIAAAVAAWLERWNDYGRLDQPPSAALVAGVLESLGSDAPDGLVDELTEVLFGRELDVPVVEPYSLAAIGSLHERGLVMGCVTNTITLEDGIRDALERLGLIRYLRSAVVSSAMGYRKPHRSLFLRALDELDVAPHEALFVGDRLVDDVGGAKTVGMRAVLTHQYRRETAEAPGAAPDAVIPHLRELPDAIRRIEAA